VPDGCTLNSTGGMTMDNSTGARMARVATQALSDYDKHDPSAAFDSPENAQAIKAGIEILWTRMCDEFGITYDFHTRQLVVDD